MKEYAEKVAVEANKYAKHVGHKTVTAADVKLVL